MNIRSRLLPLVVACIVSFGVMLLIQSLNTETILATISVRPLTEPSSIKVKMTRLEQPGGPPIIYTVNFQDYLRVVLPNEWTANWQTTDGTPESLRVGAVAVRTFGWYRVNNPLSPAYDVTDQSQVYDPSNPVSNHPNTNQAIADTSGVYLSYNNQPIRAEFRADTGNPTFNSEDDPVVSLPFLSYLRSVYEPVSNQPSLGTGLSTVGSRYWARGEDAGGTLYPPWNYRQILAHFYTSINFVGLNPTPPNTYRFNVLNFGGMDDRANNRLVLRRNQTYLYPAIVQNTGTNAWLLFCNASYGAALSHHWYSYPAKQYLSPQTTYFEGARTVLCPNAVDGSAVFPGKEYPSQDQSYPVWGAIVYTGIPAGEYWLRLDMEFPQAFIWGSRLHPTLNPNNAEWPTQDIRVLVVDQSQPSTPNPSISSGQTPGQWSNQNNVTVAWSAASDPVGVSHYKYRWDSGSWQTTGNTSTSATLSNGSHSFDAVTVANDGVESGVAGIDNIFIDATPPTANLTPLPVRVQAPDYVLSWSSADIGGSGLQEQQLTYQINTDGNWRPVTAVSNDVNMRSIRFYFPEGQQGDVYEFCLKTRDGADSWSAPSCVSTTFNPDPELHVNPLQLTWYTVYSNTQPNTQTVTIENYGGYVLTWSMTTPFTLTSIGQISGTAPSVVPIVLTHPVGITATYQGGITVTGITPGTNNSPQVISVTIYVRERDDTFYLPIIFK